MNGYVHIARVYVELSLKYTDGILLCNRKKFTIS